ncbi:conjugal transfer protein [Streptomyces sp. bgisy027]|uniref:conjugal transfer protein n=1 Tax=Streptomyces sp. bgisy027 TaxID=3413770 RepID=UPI003D764DDC
MPPAKHAPTEHAAPPTAAGARLQRMRRRVRLGHLGVWGAVAAGPIALAVAVATPSTVVRAAPATTSTAVTPAVPASPAGYATVFLQAWLRSRSEAEDTAQARLAQSLAPGVELPDTSDAQPEPVSVVAVRTAQQADTAWSVTLAAQYADGQLRYYAVPVIADSDGASFTASAAPAVVAGPAPATTAPSPYTVTVPADGAVSSAAGEFLAAYLTGAGEVDRYLAPGVRLSPVVPAPYTSLEARQVSAIEEAATTEKVPADGTKVRVLAQMEARDHAGTWPLAYELTLKARSGRWEVTELHSGRTPSEGARR